MLIRLISFRAQICLNPFLPMPSSDKGSHHRQTCEQRRQSPARVFQVRQDKPHEELLSQQQRQRWTQPCISCGNGGTRERSWRLLHPMCSRAHHPAPQNQPESRRPGDGSGRSSSNDDGGSHACFEPAASDDAAAVVCRCRRRWSCCRRCCG